MASSSNQLTLYGATLRYSTWTVRIVLLLEWYNIPHGLEIDNLPSIRARKAKGEKLPGAGFVPVLYDPSLKFYIHDSLAITEFLHEEYPQKGIWPENKALRAYARSIVAELHAGFNTLRDVCTANFCNVYKPAPVLPDAALKEIDRIFDIFDTARKMAIELDKEGDEGFLLGKVSAADVFYWPVLGRFHTYGVDTSKASLKVKAYISKMWREETTQKIAKRQFEELKDTGATVTWYDDVFPGMKLWDVSQMDKV